MLEDEKADPKRDVDEGELEVRGEVSADPKGPEWNPDCERRGGLVHVETTDAGAQLGRERAAAGGQTPPRIIR